MPLVFPVPPLSTTFSHILSLVFASIYVGSIYLSKNTRLSFSGRTVHVPNGQARPKEPDERWRDDPDIIKARLVAVGVATVICCLGVLGVVTHFVGDIDNNGSVAFYSTLARLGFTLDGFSIFPYLIAPLLYLGPLCVLYLSETLPFQSAWSIEYNVRPLFMSWVGIRNYVFAPVTEELVFRACVLSVYQLSGASVSTMVFLSPMSFGAAHVHHAWEIFNRYGRTAAAAKRATMICFVQFAYTAIFGFYCSWLFIRTGSIFPPIVAHSFCNIMGLPELSHELRRFPERKAVILAAYVIGIAGFVYTLKPWTYSGESLYWVRISLEALEDKGGEVQLFY